MEHRVDVVERVKRAEHVRPDDHAGGEIAEHGAQAQRAPERCGNDGGGEKHRHLNELRRHHGLPSDFLILPSTRPPNSLAGAKAFRLCYGLRCHGPDRDVNQAEFC